MSEVCQLEDEELVEELKRYGEDPGPIMDNTRGLYQRKLARLMAEKAKGLCECDTNTLSLLVHLQYHC